MTSKDSRGHGGRAVTSEERELLAGAGADLFEYLVGKGAIADDDPRVVGDGPDREAFDLLVKLGLIDHDAKAHSYLAVDPSIVSSHVVTPMTQQGAVLITESSEWARTFSDLGLTWRRSPGAKQGPFTEIHGRQRINELLEGVVDDARKELLTAQPQVSRAGLVGAKEAAARDLRALQRGVGMRTLYQHSARRSTTTYAYVNAVTAEGAEVRTLDEFFKKLIVIDREVAFIPGHESVDVALMVREPSMLAYLVDIFERAWERARPFVNREPGTVRDIATEQREMTVRMLKEGHADPSAAKRLGVSPRTYAGYVADLKHEYEAETRFQLGYAMGLRDAALQPTET